MTSEDNYNEIKNNFLNELDKKVKERCNDKSGLIDDLIDGMQFNHKPETNIVIQSKKDELYDGISKCEIMKEFVMSCNKTHTYPMLLSYKEYGNFMYDKYPSCKIFLKWSKKK